MWEIPILVITAQLGAAISARRLISPKSLIPISTTATSCSGSRRNIVSGNPTWLLWFPSVRITFFSAERASAIISFVVVFPTLPVTPTTGIENRWRYAVAISCNAERVLGTRIQAWESSISVCSSVRVATAPAANVAVMYACASVRSPLMGTNSAPGSIFRLSVLTEVTTASGSPHRSFPPQALRISSTVIFMVLPPFLLDVLGRSKFRTTLPLLKCPQRLPVRPDGI